jgi:uncharacterized membrane protein
MRSLTLKFLVALLLAFSVAFLFARRMEVSNYFDSLGLWYTLYVAAFFVALAAAVVVVSAIALARRRARRLRASRQ